MQTCFKQSELLSMCWLLFLTGFICIVNQDRCDKIRDDEPFLRCCVCKAPAAMVTGLAYGFMINTQMDVSGKKK